MTDDAGDLEHYMEACSRHRSALRQAATDLRVAVTVYRKMEAGTEDCPIHVRRADAEAAVRRIEKALA